MEGSASAPVSSREGRSVRARPPRIPPGARQDIGRFNYALAGLLGAFAGGGRPNVFTTLARHRRLFGKWLRFAGALMPGGVLPRDETELLILRVAHNCSNDYERAQHERIALTAGLSRDEVERVREGPQSPGWSDRRALLLRAADELHEQRTISDTLWDQLRPLLSDVELIELCMLVGHYEMLAMTLNALAVQPDSFDDGSPPRALRLLQRAAQRRSRARRSA
jgi:alkylhydroperoxidase family enzyme